MPSTLYEFLQAMCAIQDYSLQVAVGAQRELKDPGKHRDPHYQITFRMNEKFKYFEPALRVVHDNIPIFDYTGWDEQQRGDYDCYIRFDEDMFERAKSISQLSGSHITVGLNHLIGSGSGPLPVLNALKLNEERSIFDWDVLLIEWDKIETIKFQTFITTNYPQLAVIIDSRDWSSYSVADTIKYVNETKCVIGPKGVGTYIAAALKKTVIELFSSNEEGRLYGVAGTPNYTAVVGQKHTATYLWTVWESICRELTSNTKSHVDKTVLEIPESTVETANEK